MSIGESIAAASAKKANQWRHRRSGGGESISVNSVNIVASEMKA